MDVKTTMERLALVGLGAIIGIAGYNIALSSCENDSASAELSASNKDPAFTTQDATSLELRLVKQFFAAQSARDLDQVCTFVAEDIVYINEPHPSSWAIHGKTQFRKAFASSVSMQCSQADLVIRHMAQKGDLVFVERLDSFKIHDKWLHIPICGYLKIRDNQIEFWKDYWDYRRYKDFIDHQRRRPSSATFSSPSLESYSTFSTPARWSLSSSSSSQSVPCTKMPTPTTPTPSSPSYESPVFPAQPSS